MKNVPEFSMRNCVIAVSDFDCSIKFFSCVLGFEIDRSKTSSVGALQVVHLRRHDSKLQLRAVDSGRQAHSEAGEGLQKLPDPGTQTLRIGTSDLDKFYRRIEMLDVVGLTEIHCDDVGFMYCSFRNPEGNLIQIDMGPEDVPFVRAVQHSCV